jgi:RimJ/RimL family protein N-acetyltransferase
MPDTIRPPAPPEILETTLPVVVRRVRPGDLGALDELLSALDERSRYRRWFTVATDVHRAAAWAADPDRVNGVGLVAIAADGQLVGHAALVPMDDETAEVCFEVAAAWRHHGVAGRLLSGLDREAAARRLTTLVAEVLPENADMLAVMREHGACRERREGNVIEVLLPVGARPPGDASAR